MGFWIFMLLMNEIVPFTMIGFGKLFLNHAPDEINMVFGYRTRMSTKNKDTWEFAHKYCGRLWFIWGWILLPISVIPMFFVMGQSEDMVGNVSAMICILQCVFLVGSIFPTERALRRNFDENGLRREENEKIIDKDKRKQRSKGACDREDEKNHEARNDWGRKI